MAATELGIIASSDQKFVSPADYINQEIEDLIHSVGNRGLMDISVEVLEFKEKGLVSESYANTTLKILGGIKEILGKKVRD